MLTRAVRGFTIIELMVGLALLAILLVLALPSFTQMAQNMRLRAHAESLSNGLQLARSEALRRNLSTVIIAHIAFSVSFVVVVVRTSLKNFDNRLEEAAADLGANPWRAFWRVTFPLILPGIIGGALLAFTLSLDDFIISLFLSGPGTSLLPVEVYNKVRRAVTPEINAITTLMLVLSISLVVLSQAVQRRG